MAALIEQVEVVIGQPRDVMPHLGGRSFAFFVGHGFILVDLGL
jgi:hypothetical protein